MINGEPASVAWSGASSPASVQTRRRAAARAVSIATNAWSTSSAKVSTSRDTVGSDATGPNTAGSARSRFTSARQSPPNANATARSSTILPGSWIANGFRHGRSAVDNDRPRPLVRIVSTSNTPPAWPTAADPLVSTCRRGYSPVVCFTWKVLPAPVRLIPREDPSSLVRSTFQSINTHSGPHRDESPGLAATSASASRLADPSATSAESR